MRAICEIAMVSIFEVERQRLTHRKILMSEESGMDGVRNNFQSLTAFFYSFNRERRIA